MSKREITTLSSTLVYQNRWMRVREDQIQRLDGSKGIYGVVEKPDFAVIAAFDHGLLHLVEQYRYPIQRRCWELPQGAWEAGKQDPLALARAELLEETGISAMQMQHVGKLHEAYGYSTQAFDIFFATELSFGSQQLDTEEQGLVAKAFSVSNTIEVITDGTITDAATVAAIGLLRLKGHI